MIANFAKQWTDGDEWDVILAARSMVAARQALYKSLPVSLIHAPALDMLLGVFVADNDKRVVSVADVCASTPLSYQSAFRWFNVLKSEGFFDARDGQLGATVTLTLKGAESVRNAVRAVIQAEVELHNGGSW